MNHLKKIVTSILTIVLLFSFQITLFAQETLAESFLQVPVSTETNDQQPIKQPRNGGSRLWLTYSGDTIYVNCTTIQDRPISVVGEVIMINTNGVSVIKPFSITGIGGIGKPISTKMYYNYPNWEFAKITSAVCYPEWQEMSIFFEMPDWTINR